jgi:hypothetical protein
VGCLDGVETKSRILFYLFLGPGCFIKVRLAFYTPSDLFYLRVGDYVEKDMHLEFSKLYCDIRANQKIHDKYCSIN